MWRRWALCVAGFVEGQIVVLSPRTARVKFESTNYQVEGSTATFGAPYYGETVTGRLLYGQYQGEATHPHCDGDKYTVKDPQDLPQADPEAGATVVDVIIVERGGCSFVQKVREAQKKRAHAVIVVDRHKPGGEQYTAQNIQTIIMGDDGWGSEVTIPSVLVAEEDGQKLIDAVQETAFDVVVQLRWDLAQSQEVLVDFWMSSGSHEAVEFLSEFRPYAESMNSDSNQRVDFIPHYHLFSLPQNLNQMCFDEQGLWCSSDPDSSGPVTGRDVVQEDLRQMCLWHRTAESEDPEDAKFERFSHSWWTYIKRFHEQCFSRDSHGSKAFGEQCSLEVMESIPKAKQLKGAIERCVADDYEIMLNRELHNTAWGPLAVRINGWRYRGTLDVETVLRAVCSSFLEASKPQACLDVVAHFGGSRLNKVYRQDGLSFAAAAGVLAGTLCLIVVILALYNRYLARAVRSALREEVMLEVKAAVMQRSEAYQSMP